LVKKKGHIAIVTQSATVGAAMECWAEREGIGISKCVNLGNKVDVNEMDLLEYLRYDGVTKVIALYIEGVTDGRRFIAIASEVSKEKPIVALKGGRTEAGLRAVVSHTKSLAGKDEIVDAVFKQTGIIRAETLEEFYDISKAFSFLPIPKGRGVLIITSTGGSGILAADMCEKLGLALPEPSEHTKNRLRKVLPSRCTFSNPFDLTMTTCDKFRLVMDENVDDDRIHAFITIFGDPIPGAAEEIKRASMEIDKPIIVSYLGGGEVETIERNKMHSMGVPVFPSPERAVIALHALVKYSEFLRRTKT